MEKKRSVGVTVSGIFIVALGVWALFRASSSISFILLNFQQTMNLLGLPIMSVSLIGLLVLICFVIGGISLLLLIVTHFLDCLDGTIARMYNQISDLGKKLDTVSDKIFWTVITLITFKGSIFINNCYY